MKKFFALLSLSLSLISFAGCSRGKDEALSPSASEKKESVQALGQEAMNTVSFLDSYLRDRVAVQYAPAARRNSDATLRVFVVLRNFSGTVVELEGRARFFNAGRVPSDGPTEWKSLVLPPHTTVVYDDSSTARAEAAYFMVEFRGRREEPPGE